MRDEYAEKECPDLLLSQKDYHRRTYVKLMQHSSIGLVNQGLEDSIGAKFGEYVAHSLAIITTPIDKYRLLGPLAEGKNYLVYQNAAQCLDLTERLFENQAIRTKMQQANKEYYQEYLHPGKKLEKIFEMINEKKTNSFVL